MEVYNARLATKEEFDKYLKVLYNDPSIYTWVPFKDGDEVVVYHNNGTNIFKIGKTDANFYLKPCIILETDSVADSRVVDNSYIELSFPEDGITVCSLYRSLLRSYNSYMEGFEYGFTNEATEYIKTHMENLK